MSLLVPFTSREWKIVQGLFQKHGDDLTMASEILTMWQARQGSDNPVIFQITDHLLHMDRLYRNTNFKDDYSVKTLINNYSASIVRVINYINECCQTQEGTSTIASSVAILGVPQWVVDIRHRAAHNHMPPLEMFRKASECLRELLWEKYWSKTVEEAMKWAMPKKAFDDALIKNRIAKKKEPAFDLMVKFCKWRNENGNRMIKPEEIKDIPILAEVDQFVKTNPDVVIAILAEDVLVISQSRLDKAGFAKDYVDGIWPIPQELQFYWTPVISIVNKYNLMMKLLSACLRCMYAPECSNDERKQLAGWVDLFLEMLMLTITAKNSANNSDTELSEWRHVIKCILKTPEDFTPNRAIEVLKTTKMFNDKKTDQLVRLIKLRARDFKASKAGQTDDPRFALSLKNLNYIGNVSKNLNHSVSGIMDVNEGQEWCIADVDFTDVPLGLMPDQSSESLYLFID